MISNLKEFQYKILKWIEFQGFVTWKEIQKVSRSFITILPEEEVLYYGAYPEYKIVIPLFRNGCIEVCNYNEKNGFRYVWNWQESDCPEIKTNPLRILETFPSLLDIIKTFPDAKQEISFQNLKMICNIAYNYKYISKTGDETGIYKVDDQPWYNEYIYIKEQTLLKKIPDFESKEYDSLNVARTYSRMKLKPNSPIFKYNKERQELIFNDYTSHRNWGNDFPIILLRALLMFDQNQLSKEEYYSEITENLIFTNIPNSAYNELLRITGEKNG